MKFSITIDHYGKKTEGYNGETLQLNPDEAMLFLRYLGGYLEDTDFRENLTFLADLAEKYSLQELDKKCCKIVEQILDEIWEDEEFFRFIEMWKNNHILRKYISSHFANSDKFFAKFVIQDLIHCDLVKMVPIREKVIEALDDEMLNMMFTNNVITKDKEEFTIWYWRYMWKLPPIFLKITYDASSCSDITKRFLKKQGVKLLS